MQKKGAYDIPLSTLEKKGSLKYDFYEDLH